MAKFFLFLPLAGAVRSTESSSMIQSKVVDASDILPQHKHTNRHAKSHKSASLSEVSSDTVCNNLGIYKATWSQTERDTDGSGTVAAPAPGPTFEESLKDWCDTGYESLINDLKAVFTTEHSCWPSDAGHYGPFMIRLAWHAAGSFRASDNVGGAAGGRIRFFPEANWPDNANLDKARSMLAPIKDKYGDKLSWGDLFILAGTLAIVDMGGPTTTFCFGRRDDDHGGASMQLNCDPSVVDSLSRCAEVDPDLFAQDQQGLIYVNAQGPNGDPNPYMSAQDIKRTFKRMGMTFQQTTALVGGGHAFGQSHALAGENGDVKTAGFEGAWTNNPTEWDNEYFDALINEDWEPIETKEFNAQVKAVHPTHTAIQWQTVNRTSEYKDTMMTTADIGIKAHPDFSVHALRYANHQTALDTAFREAWELLTTRGPGWVTHKQCIQLDDYY